jgi:hypothetical protein
MSKHIELGHALITMIEPKRDTVRQYNRWYEHDHFLSGVLTGPGAFAGRRFVATRDLKELRFPEDSPLARPLDDGSFITVYWIERDQLAAHCDWGFPEAARLAALGRMNTDRHHVSTSYYDLAGHTPRDKNPVPVELALHHPYPGLVMIWTSTSATDHEARAAGLRAHLTEGESPISRAVTFRPIVLPDPLPAMPGVIIDRGKDGPAAGEDELATDILAHCCFVDGDVAAQWPTVSALIEKSLATAGVDAVLVAPFIPTVPGTDTYLDELW